jgi:tRNA-dihydrouridine synthase B
MRDEVLVGKILEAVVKAVNVPVTLKTRTGWARAHRNGVAVARIAEASGIAALAVHGRTREDLYQGEAEYDTIAEIRAAVSLPLWVNGDIDSPQKSRRSDASNRCGWGNDRSRRARSSVDIPRGCPLPADRTTVGCTNRQETAGVLLGHLRALYEFYGPEQGLRIAPQTFGLVCRTAGRIHAVSRAGQ